MFSMKRDNEREISILVSTPCEISKLCRNVLNLQKILSNIHPYPDRVHVALNEESIRLNLVIKQKEHECLTHLNTISKLTKLHSNAECKVQTLTRDISLLRAEQIVPQSIHTMPHIPLDVQERDAVYWHQTCRKLQQQIIQLQRNLSSKEEQILMLNSITEHLKKQTSSRRDMEIFQTTDAPDFARDSPSGSPEPDSCNV